MTRSQNTGQFISRKRDKLESNNIDDEADLRQAYSMLYDENAMSSVNIVSKERSSAVGINKRRGKKYSQSNMVRERHLKESEPDSNAETILTTPIWIQQKDTFRPRNSVGGETADSNYIVKDSIPAQMLYRRSTVSARKKSRQQHDYERYSQDSIEGY